MIAWLLPHLSVLTGPEAKLEMEAFFPPKKEVAWRVAAQSMKHV